MLIRVLFECFRVLVSAFCVYLGYLLFCRAVFGRGSREESQKNENERADADDAEYLWRKQKQNDGMPSVVGDDEEAKRILKRLNDK